MTTPPLFLRKNVILKRLDRQVVQECDSKGVRRARVLSRIDSKRFRRWGRATTRGFIGDLAWIRADVRIISAYCSTKVIEC
jgi:hypothetical protein